MDAAIVAKVTDRGMLARRAVLVGMVAALVVYTWTREPPDAALVARAAVFGIIGLSLNVLMGYAGQISLGHNAFVGVGAFAAAYLTGINGMPMYLSIPLAAIIGGVSATILGGVALRIQGLYLALITLAYGLVAERSIFEIQPLTGGGGGRQVFRPDPFQSPNVFAFVCIAVLAIVIYLDWRMIKTKFGRALLALKSNEQVASSFGMSPVFFKLAAFVLAGTLAGLGGGLLAFAQLGASAQDFTFSVALTYVIMVVIGGLGSRTGVVIGSVITAYLGHWLESVGRVLEDVSWLRVLGEQIPVLKFGLTATLLLLTITFFPGGIAQQIKPFTTWLSGKPFPRRTKGGGRRARKAEVYAGMEAPDPAASVPEAPEE